MTRIVRTHYRYKRPTRRKKVVALEVPAIVAIDRKTRVAKTKTLAAGSVAEPVEASAADAMTSVATSDQRGTKSAIVTARRPRARAGNRHLLAELPDTDEEHRRRGDAADAMFQEMKRQIVGKVRKP